MNIIDVRTELPLATDWEIGRFGPKTSRTYHWNGPPLPDIDPMELILGDANYHTTKDWGDAVGIQAGDGIMYHKLIARNGDLYITRDEDAVLWSCGSAEGNEQSEHVQVMCGATYDENDVLVFEQKPTEAQLDTMAMLEHVQPLGATWPHGPKWTQTKCPGPTVRSWVAGTKWKEIDNDMTDEQMKELLDKQDAQTDAIAIYLARVQRGVDVATGLAYDAANNGKDPAPAILASRRNG